MNIAIFRKHFGNYSETFVKNNVETINGGKTVVVCHDIIDQCDWHGDRPILELSKVPLKLRWIYLYVFLRRHRVKGCVVEFLDYAIKFHKFFEKAKIPYVALGHGYDIGRSLHRIKGYKDDVQRLRSALKVVVPCHHAKKVITDKTKLSPDKIHVVPVGIDLAKFESSYPEQDPNKAIYVGRFVEKKFPILMLYSFYLAWQKAPHVKLVCIGEGPLAPAAKDLCRVLKMESAVQFMGSQGSEVVRREIDSARMLIQHSGTPGNRDMETMPLSVQEALSVGTPAVVSDHSGLPEIVDDAINGFVVKEGDFEAMSSRILALFEMSEGRYSQFSSNCLEKRKSFDYKIRRNYINSLFEDV